MDSEQNKLKRKRIKQDDDHIIANKTQQTQIKQFGFQGKRTILNIDKQSNQTKNQTEQQKENQNAIEQEEEDKANFENVNEECDEYEDEYEEEIIVDQKHQNDQGIWESDDNEEQIIEAKQISALEEKHSLKNEKGNGKNDKNKNKNKKDKKNKKSKTENTKIQPWLEPPDKLQAGEELDYDNRAYEMLHRAHTEWPCLSFDFILPNHPTYRFQDKYSEKMHEKGYPYTIYLVAGTQSQIQSQNALYIIQLSNLHQTKFDDDSDQEEEDNNNMPQIALKKVGIKSGVNRVKAMNHSPLITTWNEAGEVNVYNLTKKFDKLLQGSALNNEHNRDAAKQKLQKKLKKQANQKGSNLSNKYLMQCFKNPIEGYAIDNSYLEIGSCDAKIYLYSPTSANLSQFTRSAMPYTFHSQSIEDIQFSPVEPFAFASCSVDRSIKICDIRVGTMNKAQVNMNKAHETDVNVIHWNSFQSNLLASGSDDGCFKVWDLRYSSNSITDIQWHDQAITSIFMQPMEESVVAVSSDDNRLSIWDFAVEAAQDECVNLQQQKIQEEENNVPEQLMFLHQGQKNIKELKYHPIYYEMIVSTSIDAFNIFKPNLDDFEAQKQQDKMSSASGEDKQDQSIPKIHEKDLDAYLSKMKLDNPPNQN